MTTALELIRRWEGCSLQAYPDPMSDRAVEKRRSGKDDYSLSGAPWTIGYGVTGPEIHEGLVWTQEQADAELERRLGPVNIAWRLGLKVPITQSQAAALGSLAWNVGGKAVAESSILRLLNDGDITAAGNAFLAFDYARGRPVPGLLRRRSAERAVFLDLTPSVTTEL